MFRDRDFDVKAPLPPMSEAVAQDLGLDTLFDAMAAADEFLREIARRALFGSLAEPAEIGYRQQILRDCLAFPAVVREMYALAVEVLERERKIWGWALDRYPETVLRRSLEALRLFLEGLRRLRGLAEAHSTEAQSAGFKTLFAMLRAELSEDYLQKIEAHARQLELREGVLLEAHLGEGNAVQGYTLRKLPDTRAGVLGKIWTWIDQLGSPEHARFVYQLADRDEAGHQALGEIRSRGLVATAVSLGRSTDHILSFFTSLRAELGFYVGCLNLRERLAAKGDPIAIPEVIPAQPYGASSATLRLDARGLYDVALTLNMQDRVIGNDLKADDKQLIVITGANRGGKTTFLRSLGQALLMMQCGLYVGAEALRATTCSGVFTHFKREEDRAMRMGKLDEELARMSAIVERVRSGGCVLFNESFASTNEREGSEIARQVIRALLEAGVRIAYVTHLYDLARSLCHMRGDATLFLRAERLADGERTFRVTEGDPLPTSYGRDLYRRIFDGGPEGQGTGRPDVEDGRNLAHRGGE